MSKSIALLSGKGGSGKTTLALSMATLLSKCGLKVLLIDCDLNTNGATYFYEGKMSDKSNLINSFYDIYISKTGEFDKLLKIDNYLSFMPSVVSITKENTESYKYNESDLNWIHGIDINLRKLYDIIIYDCQAGYTDVLKLILPFVDISLIVMEADAISSSSIRSFFLKVGDLINDKKVYQVFNKATEEEYQIYSKVTGVTLFTNIETIMFDWKIRKAFSVAQVPDMESTSFNYGEQIYNICTIIFNEEQTRKKLLRFETEIKRKRLYEERDNIQTGIDEYKSIIKKDKIRRLAFILFWCYMLIFMGVAVFFLLTNHVFDNNLNFFVLVLLITSTFSVGYIMLINFSQENKRIKRLTKFDYLSEEKRLIELKKQIYTIDKKEIDLNIKNDD